MGSSLETSYVKITSTETEVPVVQDKEQKEGTLKAFKRKLKDVVPNSTLYLKLGGMRGIRWSTIQVLSDSNINVYSCIPPSGIKMTIVFVTIRGGDDISDFSSVLAGIIYITQHLRECEISTPLFAQFFIRNPVTREGYACMKEELSSNGVVMLSLKNKKDSVAVQIKILE